MTISNAAYAAGQAALYGVTDSEVIAALEALTDSWNGGSLSNVKLAQEISANQVLQAVRDGDISALALGTADAVITDPAGQPEPGYYPIRITRSGAIVWQPSRAKLQTEMLRGDPARTGFVAAVFGKPAANIVFSRYPSPGDMVFTNAGCIGDAEVAATATSIFPITKNGSLVGNATFAASSAQAVFTFTGGSLSITRGDLVRVISPSSIDLTLFSPTLVFAGDP